MRALELWVVVYLFNSIWQIPLVFAAAWVATRLARPAGPRSEHRIWVIALIAEIILPLCQLDLANLWQHAWALLAWNFGRETANSEVRVLISPPAVSSASLLRLPTQLLTAIAIAYACTLLYFSVRLAWGLWRTGAMRREAQLITPTDALTSKLARHMSLFKFVEDQATIAISPILSGPVTIGFRRPFLLLSPTLLERVSSADLEAILAHELAHIKRGDFAKNIFYGILSLPIAWHPALWLTRSRLAETREMVCDAIAAEVVTGREDYARSLLRLASMLSDLTPARTLHAIGIFDANIFERRVMNLIQKRVEITSLRRFAIAAACALVTVITCASALTLRMDVSAARVQTERPKSVHVKFDDLKLIAQVHPVYPPEAKSAKIEGSVLLDVLISKEGVPEHISVQKGPRELQTSALDAVRQWRWQPYLLNGDPIDVETTVTVIYALNPQ